jgi:hypothetical protein
MLTKTNLSIDVDRLLPLLAKVNWDDKNRCQLNSPSGNWLYDPYYIKDIWKGTAFEELLDMLAKDYPIGEARLIKLAPGTCYPCHTDVDDRLHVNLIGNDQSYLIDLDEQIMYRTIADNHVYYMDASHRHVAANFGSYDRIQLVVRIRLATNNNPEFILKTIKFNSVYDRFRYDFDNTISQVISHKIKQKKIDFFDVKNNDEIVIKADVDTFNDIVNRIKQINEDFQIL